MASLTYLDTHVVVWLYIPRLDLFSAPARRRLDEGGLLVSPMVVLELQFLHETGRLRDRSRQIVESLQEQLGLEICTFGFPAVVEAAIDQSWTRDPFDRIIVGHAAAAQRALVSRDETIRKHYADAIW